MISLGLNSMKWCEGENVFTKSQVQRASPLLYGKNKKRNQVCIYIYIYPYIYG